MYNATMFDLSSRYVVPTYSPIEDNDKETILKDYYETLQVLDRMDLQNSLLPMLINNFMSCLNLVEQRLYLITMELWSH